MIRFNVKKEAVGMSVGAGLVGMSVGGATVIHGKSAYELAVENGFEGSEADWLESLRGKAGYTPQKGVDYWTEADKLSIVDAVLAAIPKYNGEVEVV